MIQPEKQYIRRVLGVQSWIVPESADITPVAALCAEGLPDGAEALLQKMFAAIGVSKFEVITEDSKLEKFQGAFVFPFGEVSDAAKTDQRLIDGAGSLRDLLNNDDPEKMKTLKRTAWDHLQKLKWRLSQ